MSKIYTVYHILLFDKVIIDLENPNAKMIQNVNRDLRQRKHAPFLYRDCRIMIANIHILVVEGVLTYLFLGDQGILAKLLRHCFHDPNNLKQSKQ